MMDLARRELLEEQRIGDALLDVDARQVTLEHRERRAENCEQRVRTLLFVERLLDAVAVLEPASAPSPDCAQTASSARMLPRSIMSNQPFVTRGSQRSAP